MRFCDRGHAYGHPYTGRVTLRIGPFHLSGFAVWALFMAVMLAALAVIEGGELVPTAVTAAAAMTVLAAYDTVMRHRHGGKWPGGVRHVVAAALVAGATAITLTVVVFASLTTA